MSNISTAYDEIETAIVALLPNHVELVNPYQPELNDDITFEKAWGLVFLAGFNTNREIACHLTINRQFEVILARKMYTGPMRTIEGLTERKRAEKDLFEDHYIIAKGFEENSTIRSSTAITNLQFDSDSGLEFVRAGQADLILVRMTFNMEYFENVSL